MFIMIDSEKRNRSVKIYSSLRFPHHVILLKSKKRYSVFKRERRIVWYSVKHRINISDDEMNCEYENNEENINVFNFTEPLISD
jgi:hypothetical protein